MKKEFASMDFGKYKVEYNEETKKFDIIRKGVGLIISCTNEIAYKQVLKALGENESKNKEEDHIMPEVLEEVERLNNIKEPKRDLTNRILNIYNKKEK